jgi:leucyl aminopeptidase
VAEGVEFTRELVTEPANVIYPESFVARCQERLAGTGVEIVVLDDSRWRRWAWARCSAWRRVGQEAAPARHALEGQGRRAHRFVGKGVCFDTGGIRSSRPPAWKT